MTNLKHKNYLSRPPQIRQIITNQYLEPFKADKRKVIGLAVELDENGKGLIDWAEVN